MGFIQVTSFTVALEKMICSKTVGATQSGFGGGQKTLQRTFACGSGELLGTARAWGGQCLELLKQHACGNYPLAARSAMPITYDML